MDGQGQGTILDDLEQAKISIDDVTVVEGNNGTTNAVFTVTLLEPNGRPISVGFATANGTAEGTADAGLSPDYGTTSGVLTFAPGETTKTITVAVLGDTDGFGPESDETFLVNLFGASPFLATITDGQGQGTILNDDEALSINDATVLEANNGTTTAVFTATLTGIVGGQTVTVDYVTADGTATAGSDYVESSGVLTFGPGVTTQTIAVTVNGDIAPGTKRDLLCHPEQHA